MAARIQQMPSCVLRLLTFASHILFAQRGIRASRPAPHPHRKGGSGLNCSPCGGQHGHDLAGVAVTQAVRR